MSRAFSVFAQKWGNREGAVHRQIRRRIRDVYPNRDNRDNRDKLRHQFPEPWKLNTAFVNCYVGSQESLSYHQTSSPIWCHCGPDEHHHKDDDSLAEAQGQVSIHLRHNLLLIMYAKTQEEWKHSIVPAQSIDLNPLAKSTRINMKYWHYRESLHPKSLSRCSCGIPLVFRCVQRKKTPRQIHVDVTYQQLRLKYLEEL
ncbi:putative CUE domain protein [Lasiosphaeria ovina]|uniref:CUE domain protein n=1 Tax=Lasiosphaeria ovina TaxID=92902 RepID=A0AAE0NIF3_9PEZI|nr:putative CUE domain protein [Lasiosphaeria ovina]